MLAKSGWQEKRKREDSARSSPFLEDSLSLQVFVSGTFRAGGSFSGFRLHGLREGLEMLKEESVLLSVMSNGKGQTNDFQNWNLINGLALQSSRKAEAQAVAE